jgi:RNA recognition motif-containing protein
VINIYVGNLPYKTSEADLAELFAAFGQVDRSSIVMDRQTGRSRGFGFVEMADHAEGTRAIEALAGQDWHGRPLTINEARPRGSGTTGGNTGFSSSTTSFGESTGYSNSVSGENTAPAEPSAKPDADAELANAAGDTDEPPVSRGYSNQMVD